MPWPSRRNRATLLTPAGLALHRLGCASVGAVRLRGGDPARFLDSDAYSGRGFARLRLGEHRQAVADAEKAFRLASRTRDVCTTPRGFTPSRPSWPHRGPQEGQEAVARRSPVPGPGTLAPRGPEAAPGRPPRGVPERRDPDRPPVRCSAVASLPGSGRASHIFARGHPTSQAEVERSSFKSTRKTLVGGCNPPGIEHCDRWVSPTLYENHINACGAYPEDDPPAEPCYGSTCNEHFAQLYIDFSVPPRVSGQPKRSPPGVASAPQPLPRSS